MKYDSSVPQFVSKAPIEHLPPFKEATKRTPDRTVNIWLPLVAALATGFVVFIAVWLIAWGLEWPRQIPRITAGAAMLFIFFFCMWRLFSDQLLFSVEQIFGLDIDRNGTIGKPQKPETWSIEMQDPANHNNLEYFHFDTEELRFGAIKTAYLLGQGTPFSEGALCGTNRPLSRNQFNDLRDLFFAWGWCQWKDPKVHTCGLLFTVAGKRHLRELADFYERMGTPPPRMRTQGGEYVPQQLTDGGVGGGDDAE